MHSVERNPQTQQIVAIHEDISNFQQRRTFWMDGRPHPSQFAAHTWSGFSTGAWEGDTLRIETTHIKAGYLRRNGIAFSDQVYGSRDRKVHLLEDALVRIEALPGVGSAAAVHIFWPVRF